MTVNDLLGDLMQAFPRQRITEGTIELYERELADLPTEALSAAVRALIRSSEWFPTVRAIREATAEQIVHLPSEPEALAQVEARMSWARDPQEKGPAPLVHPAVHETVKSLGGFFSFRSTEDPGVVRGQFLRLYRERRAQAIREIQLGELTGGRAMLGVAYPAIAR